MYNLIKVFYLIVFFFTIPSTAYSRCAICYTNGLSGASIAVLIIITSFIFLYFANKILKDFLEKNNN